MDKDLEMKEASIDNFESGTQDVLGGNQTDGKPSVGTMGDSRPDEIDPKGTEFVSAEDDPNLRITRQTSELTEPERGLAAEMDAIRHDDSSVVAKPMGPLDEEGAELRPRREEGEDS